jgi:hypothetical protein
MYPYVYITRYYVPKDSGYDWEYVYNLYFSRTRLTLTSAGWQFVDRSHIGQIVGVAVYKTMYEDVWTHVRTYEPGQLAIGEPGGAIDLFWSNVDVLDENDNSVKFSASDPIPVYE